MVYLGTTAMVTSCRCHLTWYLLVYRYIPPADAVVYLIPGSGAGTRHLSSELLCSCDLGPQYYQATATTSIGVWYLRSLSLWYGCVL